MNEQLEKLDYDIIEFIKNNPNIHKDKIREHFPNIESLDERLMLLSRSEQRQDIQGRPLKSKAGYIIPLSKLDTSFHLSNNYTGEYKISGKGKRVLQDHKIRLVEDRKAFWMKSILTPIGVSIVTTILALIITWIVTKQILK